MGTSSDTDAAAVVGRQLAAYNDRDIDAFMACWADDCRYYEFPDRLLATGAAEIRARHVERFKEANLHGRLKTRIVAANLVVDEETVTRTFPDGPGEVDVVAIYEVEHGRIARAWFRMGAPRRHGEVPQPAEPAQAGAIRALVRDAYAKWVPVIGREPRPMVADVEAAIRDHRVDVVMIGREIAAVIEMVPGADHLLIENIAIAPAYQRQGLGHRLLAHAERVAVSLGHPVLRLYTNTLFDGNVRLYQSVGYTVDRAEAFMGGTTVHLSKRLRPDAGPAAREA